MLNIGLEIDSQIVGKIGESLQETFFMVISALVAAVILGGLLGLVLYMSSNKLFFKNKVLHSILGAVLNVVRSVPFLILMIFLLPLSALIVGTKIGSSAVIVPLAIASIAFFARLAEASFADVDKGVIEAAVASGAKKSHIVFKILLPEAAVSLIKNITVTAISILGFSAMAGLVGGGGIGDLAYRYGYQRYQQDVMIICVILLIVLVQVLQVLGDSIAKAVQKK